MTVRGMASGLGIDLPQDVIGTQHGGLLQATSWGRGSGISLQWALAGAAAARCARAGA